MISQHLVSQRVVHSGQASLLRSPQVSAEVGTNGDRPSHPSSVTSVHRLSAEQALLGSTRLRCWERLSHGLYVPRGSRPLAVELAAWQLVLPARACFTSLSSAELRGWWQPARVSHPVFVSVPSDAPHPQRRGLNVTRHPRPVDFEIIDGIRVASAAETLLAVARDLGVLDLMIIGDSALHLGACTIDQLSMAAAGRRRGAPRLRTVLPCSTVAASRRGNPSCGSCTVLQTWKSSRRRRSTTSGAVSWRGLISG